MSQYFWSHKKPCSKTQNKGWDATFIGETGKTLFSVKGAGKKIDRGGIWHSVTSPRQVPMIIDEGQRGLLPIPGVLAIGAHLPFLQCDSGYASVYRPNEQKSSGPSLFY